MSDEDEPHDSPGVKIGGVDGEFRMEVGYKRPPKMHRFHKGRSGNPKGRPRKSTSRRQIVQRVLFEKKRVDLSGNGRPLEWTIIEIVVMRVRQDALEGNSRAMKTYTRIESRFGTQEQVSKGGVIVIPTVNSREEWERLFGAKD